MRKIFFCSYSYAVAVVTVLLVIFLHPVHASTTTSLNEIPNPMMLPEECGRPGVQRSAVCDFNHVLDKESLDVIESRINEAAGVEYGVALVSRMETNSYESVDGAAKTYATTLHNRWGVGSEALQNGILIFVSIDDRAVYISCGKGLEAKLTDRALDLVIRHMAQYFRNKQYGQGIEAAILETSGILAGKPASVSLPDENYDWIMNYGKVGVFAFFVGLCYYSSYRQNQELRSYQRGRDALSRVTREVSKMENERYCSSSCPVCLDDFDTNAVETEKPVKSGTSSSNKLPLALRCGHILCHDCCLELFKRKANTVCPICRQPADPFELTTNSSGSRSHSSDDVVYLTRTLRTQEMMYRLDRMRYLYPSVMTQNLHASLSSSVRSGSLADFNRAAVAREQEVYSTITDLQKRKVAASSGSKGSSRTGGFGGGRSSGGRGGRW